MRCNWIPAVLLLAGLARGEQVLFNFDREFDAATVAAQDARVTAPAGALRIETFHAHPYPGITLPAPAGRWDLSAFEQVLVDVKNSGDNAVTVYCRVDNPGADGTRNCNTGSLALKPGQSGVLRVQIERRPVDSSVRLFGMRGYPPGWSPSGTLDPTNVTQLLVYVVRSGADHVFEIDSVRAAGTFTVARAAEGRAFLPFIDTFGQYIHRDWPGKVKSLDDLRARREQEQQELRQRPGPDDWNQYGGWKSGPQLKATGFFRTEKYQGKWWLFDPEGRLFISHGIDCVGMLDITPLDGREGWYENFPGEMAEFKEFLVPEAFALHGHYAGKRPRCFNFAAANLKRKYGDSWRQASAEVAHQRLRSWGLNTVGNWSNASVIRLRRTPYVATLGVRGRLIEGSQGYWGRFVDVFDPDLLAQASERLQQQARATAGDPWCIGYFVDNELSWGDEVSLALGALQSPADQPAKLAFLEDLKATHGTIEKLNAAWGTSHASWQALLESKQAPDKQRARADLLAFHARVCDQYFRVIRAALKAAAPNQLYLGCRFAWVNEPATRAAARHCDVVSFNLYRKSVADFVLPAGLDVPLIIGEFHFGALDRGMFHTGLVKATSQEDRARMYKEYVQSVLTHPLFVGCHWFQYQDEPTTGRVYDEENYQIGFVDGVDTPYPETIEASREIGYNMYRSRLGQ